ncbi:hypothetical protein [Alicyclobacillus dauci]|uniref:Uncharacterized protein n=1 Tax=Alicyclobacillus dauci TaxID=1475485 RepID=A0ABY6Z0G0_9BACL|nr:hypothetical protein [Alicyclobacillus dauci]WAH35856.1 hypothetical protein NZD86_16510 [Alicyclobacillus dauci]
MRRGQWLLAILIIVAVAVMRLRSGGSVPLPDHVQTTPNNDIRIAAKMQPIPSNSTGEQWNLTHGQDTYYVNMYLNGRQSRTFATRKLMRHENNGTLYETAGVVQFGQQKYHATEIFVNRDGKDGYIEFAKG